MTRSAWQHPFVQQVLPFLTSLAFHASLIILALLGYRTAQVIYRPVHEEQLFAGTYELNPDADPTKQAQFWSPNGIDPSRRPEQNNYPDVPVDSTGAFDTPGTPLPNALLGDGGADPNATFVISLGNADPAFRRGGRSGVSAPNGAPNGDGLGGPLAPFGVPGGGRPDVSFIRGRRDAAYKIAFVCDASGSMMTNFDDLRVELTRAIDALKPVQSFSVIFFQSDRAAFIDKDLIASTPGNKRRTFEFLANITPAGTTDPIPGLRLAFDLHPQLIYLLTDGDFPDNDAVTRYIAQRNADKKVMVNTIAFLKSGDYAKVLQKIAAANAGAFRHVAEADLASER